MGRDGRGVAVADMGGGGEGRGGAAGDRVDGELAVQGGRAGAAEDLRIGGGAAGDGAEDPAQGRPLPGILRVRRAQGQGPPQDRLLPRLHRKPHRHPPRLPGQNIF